MARFACVVLVDPRGWLLLQERDEHPVIDPDRWGFVGGHVDDSEDPDDAAYRELTEETALVAAPRALVFWRSFEIFHEAYGTHDPVRVYVGRTTATDADIIVGEGRRIVFVDPAKVLELPLTAAASAILPDLLESADYQELYR